MNHTYETDRLYLKVLSRYDARMVLDFYSANAKEFALYEPLKEEDVTNLNYHALMLDFELENYKKNTLRVIDKFQGKKRNRKNKKGD